MVTLLFLTIKASFTNCSEILKQGLLPKILQYNIKYSCKKNIAGMPFIHTLVIFVVISLIYSIFT